MTTSTFFLAILVLSAAAYTLGLKRAMAVAKPAGGLSRLHSRPAHYATLTALWCALPALAVFSLWLALEPVVVKALVVADLPEELSRLSTGRLNLVYNDIKNLVAGTSSVPRPTRPWQRPPPITGNSRPSARRRWRSWC